jgi:carboxymethylenebutenolidase
VGDSVRAWIVYPERSTPAPVVVVIHENTGLIPWTRAVADQLAAEGFLAIAPDLLTMSNLRGSPDSVDTQAALAAVATLRPDVMQRQIDSVAQYAMRLPSAVPSYGIIGFCWGGGVTFRYATHSPTLRAAVVFYGPTPPIDLLSGVHAPVLGLYGGSDARIDAGVPATDSAMRKLGKTFEPHFFEGAGHAFMRLQNGMNGANAKAAAQAWPQMLKWLRTYVGR